MIDAPNRQGYADPQGTIDPLEIAALQAALRQVWPRQRPRVNRWTAGPVAPAGPTLDGAGSVTTSYLTDVRRLVAHVDGATHLAVVRPSGLLVPAKVLRAALSRAVTSQLDLATVEGVPADAFYVVSALMVRLLGTLPLVPGVVTLPDAMQRLAGLRRSGDALPVRVGVLDTDLVGWDTADLARALPSRIWTRRRPGPWLAVESAARLARALDDEHEAIAGARASLRAAIDQPLQGRGASRLALVVLPSPFESGAHGAWTELLPTLPPSEVAFVVGAATSLHRELTARGFLVAGVTDGLVPASGGDASVLITLLDATRPAVVHFDGADSLPWLPLGRVRGARVVQHVRLADVGRFAPAFPYADAIVGVSPGVCEQLRRRGGPAIRVECLADGVRLERWPRATARVPLRDDEEVRCVCVGRVEPAKGQLRVLEIFERLRARRPARLQFAGPCGSDPAYGDQLRDRLVAPAAWTALPRDTTDLYARAHVVLVGSRSEALGMVGLEALAAGALLVAQRSLGYEAIIDPTRQEGLLFDLDEPADAVASRVVDALAQADVHAAHGRRKAAACFDARVSADRLMCLWRELARRR